MYFCESYWSLTIQFLGYPILNNLDTYHPIPISIIHTDLSNETPHLRATSVAHFKGELRLGQVLVPLKWTYFSSESRIYPLVIKHANECNRKSPLCRWFFSIKTFIYRGLQITTFSKHVSSWPCFPRIPSIKCSNPFRNLDVHSFASDEHDPYLTSLIG